MPVQSRKKKLTYNEVQQMLDDFYDEVDRQEKADGITLHIQTTKPRKKTFREKVILFFKSIFP